MFQKFIKSVILTSLMMLLGAGLSACDSNPPELMKAVKQFKTDEIRDAHVNNMRKNHMDELLHKRDETVINGIRTPKNSLKACINCHIPEEYNGKALRHTDSEYFCSTCHGYVAAQLDCFQCHTDRPKSGNNQVSKVAPIDSIHEKVQLNSPSNKHLPTTVANAVDLVNKKQTIQATKQAIGDKQ